MTKIPIPNIHQQSQLMKFKLQNQWNQNTIEPVAEQNSFRLLLKLPVTA